MRIEIVTTKKKLSKSIVNQMPQATPLALKFGAALGYMINIKKNSYKEILIEHDNLFSTIHSNYIKDKMSVCRKAGKWPYKLCFDSPAECDTWWSFYQERVKEAVTQIYI